MRHFFSRQRENIIANVVASAVFAGIMAFVALLSSLPVIPVPPWLFVALTGFIAALWWQNRPRKKLVPVVNDSFGVERVEIDGKHFISCTFKGSELVFNGKNGFSLERCKFISHHVRFESHAGIVLTMLTRMYQVPEFRRAIDNTLNNVRSHNPETPS